MSISVDKAYAAIIGRYDEALLLIIATNTWYSYAYSSYVSRKRFKLGEKAIATNGCYSYWYGRNINIKFKLGEKASRLYTNMTHIHFFASHRPYNSDRSIITNYILKYKINYKSFRISSMRLGIECL